MYVFRTKGRNAVVPVELVEQSNFGRFHSDRGWWSAPSLVSWPADFKDSDVLLPVSWNDWQSCQDSGWCVSMWESELPWRYLALIPISVCSEHCGFIEGGLEIFQADLELSSDFEQSSRLRCQRLMKNNRLRLIWWSFEFWKNYLPSAVVNCRLDDVSRHGEGPERGKGKKKKGQTNFEGLIWSFLDVLSGVLVISVSFCDDGAWRRGGF